MPDFAKNKFRTKVITRYGQEAGLPLFESVHNRLTPKMQSRFDAASKPLPLANDTKRLSRIKQQILNVELGANQQIVFDAFAECGPSTNKEISEFLKKKFNAPQEWDASTVNARNYELRQFGKMKKAGKRRCNITKEIVTIWRVENVDNAA